MLIQIKNIMETINESDLKGEYRGSEDIQIEGFSSIFHYIPNTITWIKNKSALKKQNIQFDEIALVILDQETYLDSEFPNVIICDNPKGAFYEVIRKFWMPKPVAGVGKNCVIDKSVKIGQNVSIGNNCVIEEGAVIGDGTVIKHNVVIGKKVKIGQNCKIDSCAVIGTDGFGYSRVGDKYVQVPHLGSVIIGNNVDIGGGSNIERGVMDNTIIEDGVKIDNMCLIGHNSILRKNTMVIGMTVLAGSVTTEEETYIAPGATIMNQVHMGYASTAGIGSVVIHDVEDQNVVAGVPAKVLRKERGKI